MQEKLGREIKFSQKLHRDIFASSPQFSAVVLVICLNFWVKPLPVQCTCPSDMFELLELAPPSAAVQTLAASLAWPLSRSKVKSQSQTRQTELLQQIGLRTSVWLSNLRRYSWYSFRSHSVHYILATLGLVIFLKNCFPTQKLPQKLVFEASFNSRCK